MMASSSKSSDSTNSGLKDNSSDPSDEDKPELCPGFRDVDAFVKVSELTAQSLGVQTSSREGQRGCVCGHISADEY